MVWLSSKAAESDFPQGITSSGAVFPTSPAGCQPLAAMFSPGPQGTQAQRPCMFHCAGQGHPRSICDLCLDLPAFQAWP